MTQRMNPCILFNKETIIVFPLQHDELLGARRFIKKCLGMLERYNLILWAVSNDNGAGNGLQIFTGAVVKACHESHG